LFIDTIAELGLVLVEENFFLVLFHFFIFFSFSVSFSFFISNAKPTMHSSGTSKQVYSPGGCAEFRYLRNKEDRSPHLVGEPRELPGPGEGHLQQAGGVPG